jgi:hypothetical protein
MPRCPVEGEVKTSLETGMVRLAVTSPTEARPRTQGFGWVGCGWGLFDEVGLANAGEEGLWRGLEGWSGRRRRWFEEGGAPRRRGSGAGSRWLQPAVVAGDRGRRWFNHDRGGVMRVRRKGRCDAKKKEEEMGHGP